LIGLQVLYAFHWRVNSDEPQHLHVVWAWTQGLLPYRDVFDNHTPLFQMLSAPLMWLVGERADVVAWMRLGELPFWALLLWCTWRIGRTLFSVRAGLLAVALTALYPVFATRSIEYRPDLAWAALWLVTIAIAVERPAINRGVTLRRAFYIGLAAGCAISISMKSILLIGFFLFALLLVAILRALEGERTALRAVVSMLFAGIGGFVVVPFALAAFFAAHGAWQDMLYGVFRHNMVSGLGGRWDGKPWHVWILPALLPVLCWLGLRLLRSSRQDDLGARRAVVLLAALMYWIALIGYWPLLTQQDFLPFIPLLMVFVAGGLLQLAARGWPGWSRTLTIALLAGELALLLSPKYAPWSHRESAYTRTLGTVLALTTPADLVMDCKGGSIFRTRATRLVLEGVTLHRIQLGLLRDDIPEHLQQTRVAIRDCWELPPRAHAFLDQNYLPIGDRVTVAGRRLSAVPEGTAVPFDLGVAAPYAAITEQGVFHGDIDGIAYDGPRMLAPGQHLLVSARSEPSIVLLWSRAPAHGFHAIVQAGRSASSEIAEPKAQH
jgi:4-amino-4-deoxy-L-arabinose transferase-like glycosyltransferase